MRGGETQIPQCEPASQAGRQQASRQAGRRDDKRDGRQISSLQTFCQGLPGFARVYQETYQGLPGFIGVCHAGFFVM